MRSLSTVAVAAAAVLSISCVEGHVKVFFTPTQMSVRNAASGSGDGAFSTSGACGGVNQFGANGVNEAVDGDEVCVRINYNGGHKSNANQFRTVFTCGGVGPQKSFEALTPLTLEEKAGVTSPITGGNAIAAPNGNDVAEGYTACVTLPQQQLTDATPADAPERQCTLSILDQRQWGGCIDMKLANKPAEVVPTPPPTPIPQKYFDTAAAGVYEMKACDTESGGKCCLKGYVGVTATGQMVSSLKGVSHAEFQSGTKDADSDFCAVFGGNLQTNLEWAGDEAATFTNRAELRASTTAADGEGNTASSQMYEIVARDPKANGILLVNVDPDLPIVSDGSASYSMSLDAGVQQGLVPNPAGTGSGTGSGTGTGTGTGAGGDTSPNPTDDSSNNVPIIVGIASVGVLAVGAIVVKKRRDDQARLQQQPQQGGAVGPMSHPNYDPEYGRQQQYGGSQPYYGQQQQQYPPY